MRRIVIEMSFWLVEVELEEILNLVMIIGFLLIQILNLDVVFLNLLVDIWDLVMTIGILMV